MSPSTGIGAVMTPLVRFAGEDTTVREAARLMSSEGISTLAVMAGHELSGIVSERDVVRAVADGADLDSETVATVMARSPRYLTLADDVAHAARIMASAGIRHLPVVDDAELVGIVSIRDVVTAIAGTSHEDPAAGAEPLVVERELSHPGG